MIIKLIVFYRVTTITFIWLPSRFKILVYTDVILVTLYVWRQKNCLLILLTLKKGGKSDMARMDGKRLYVEPFFLSSCNFLLVYILLCFSIVEF